MWALSFLGCSQPGAVIDGVRYDGLQAALDAARPDDVVEVGSGLHIGSFRASVPLTLRGEPGAVLDAQGRRVLWAADDIEVEGLTLRGAFADEGAAIWSDGDVRVVGSTIEAGYTDAIRALGMLAIDDSVVRSEWVLASFPLGGLEVTDAEIPPTLGYVRGTIQVADSAFVGGDTSPMLWSEGRVVLSNVRSDRSLSASGVAIEGSGLRADRVSLWADRALEVHDAVADDVLWLSGDTVNASAVHAPEINAVGYRWMDVHGVSGDVLQLNSNALDVSDLVFSTRASVSGHGTLSGVRGEGADPALLLGLDLEAHAVVVRGSASASLQALSGASVTSALLIDEGGSDVGPCLRLGNGSSLDFATFIGCGTHPLELSGDVQMRRSVFASDVSLAFHDLDGMDFADKTIEDVHAWPPPLGDAPIAATDFGITPDAPGLELAQGAFGGEEADVVQALFEQLEGAP
jgi:hypothetical protein